MRLVTDGFPANVAEVRQQYQQVRPLSQLNVKARGWTLDVLNVVSQFGKRPFSLNEVYAFEADFVALHPQNNRVREKIRQQLQILRDLGLLLFLSPGKYVLIDKSIA